MTKQEVRNKPEWEEDLDKAVVMKIAGGEMLDQEGELDINKFYEWLKKRFCQQIEKEVEEMRESVMKDYEVRRVGLTKVWWGAEISTVYLITPFPSFNRDEKLLFETMVFFRGIDRYVERYATLEEAQEGHKRIAKMARNPFKILFR
jgi:hypothetical protein